MTEAELFAGYDIREEGCACGGPSIVAKADAWNDGIPSAVRLHQLSAPHQLWRASQEPYPRPTLDFPSADLSRTEDGLSAGVRP